MKTLVTGGTGFIGSHVVGRLRDADRPVVSYDRAPHANALPQGVRSVTGELFDLGRLAATIADNEVDGIVHAAGASDPQLSIGMPAATVAANATGTADLLEASRVAGFGGRVVLLSSRTVYGDDDGLGENSPLRPRTPFAATKAFADLLGQVYVQTYGLDVVSLRISQVYGPGGQLPAFLQQVIDAAITRRPLRLNGYERPGNRLVHVEDVARSVVAALDAPAPAQRIYDIAGERVRLEQLVAIVRDRVPTAEIEVAPAQVNGSDPPEPIATSAADRELGYRPRWGLARGIDDLCIWREAEASAE